MGEIVCIEVGTQHDQHAVFAALVDRVVGDQFAQRLHALGEGLGNQRSQIDRRLSQQNKAISALRDALPEEFVLNTAGTRYTFAA